MKKLSLLLSFVFCLNGIVFANQYDVLDSGKLYKLKFKAYNYSFAFQYKFDIYSDTPNHYRIKSDAMNNITEFLAITADDDYWGLIDAHLTKPKNIYIDYMSTPTEHYYMDFGCVNLPEKILGDPHFDLPDGIEPSDSEIWI